MNTAALIRRLFALPRYARPPQGAVPMAVLRSAIPDAGEIALYTGPSGGGKSRLLDAVRAAHRDDPSVLWIEPTQIALNDADGSCVIERMCQEIGLRDAAPAPIELALELLSRVGLAEAWTYLQTPDQLSDGQRWRLILALAIARALRIGKEGQTTVTAMIAMDEFAALLDRITARIVARALRRLIDRQGDDRGPARVSAIVATSHDDLATALDPDIVVTCDFQCFAASRRRGRPATGCPATSHR